MQNSILRIQRVKFISGVFSKLLRRHVVEVSPGVAHLQLPVFPHGWLPEEELLVALDLPDELLLADAVERVPPARVGQVLAPGWSRRGRNCQPLIEVLVGEDGRVGVGTIVISNF